MIKGADDTRFGKKLESVFWWIIRLAPILLVFLCARGNGNTETTLGMAIESLSENGMSYNVFYDFFWGIFNESTGLFPIWESQSTDICSLIAWICSIEVLRFFVNFCLFIVRWANNILERWCK